MLDKQTYYVSVQSETVMLQEGVATFEFEIEANEDELSQLERLFREKDDATNATFFQSLIPGIPYHMDEANVAYDQSLKEIYRYIHKLGRPETKQSIESMGVL